MATIEMTVNANYLPNWGAWEGVRELIQNARDAETQYDAPMSVEYTQSGYLVITNKGTTIPHEALLFGTTTKSDDSRLIGKFGEGLKLGLLALARAGHDVMIQTGSENWRPVIARSERFKADVLKIQTTKAQGTPRDEVRIRVGGIKKEEWKALRDRFLFVAVTKESEVIDTSEGKLLLGERFKGRIYVKGIYVNDRAESLFGYDFSDADIDRDRRMVSSWDTEYKTARIWNEAAAARPDLMAQFLDLLDNRDRDVDSLRYTTPSEVVVDAAAARFVERHGEGVVPVKTMGESQDVAHLGKSAVIVPEPLAHVLAKKLGTTDEIKAKLASEAERFYAWGELNAAEQASLQWAVSLVGTAIAASDLLDRVDVVTFRSSKMLGQHKDGRYLLSRGRLADAEETLATLIHEVAHDQGGDGEHAHVAAMEGLWVKVVRALRSRSASVND